MSLKEIFCQDKAIGLLQRAFTAGKMPHAYIFAGPEGVGKYKTAWEWAKLLLCKNPVAEKINGGDFSDSCGSCQSCRLFETDSHPDFHCVYKELREFTADGKGKGPPVDLPVDVIREFLVAKVQNKPTLSQRKVFVVSEAEKLNVSSQNCLLKVLEEPPAYCCIILLCTRLERLLPTTRSRCQIIRFGPIDQKRIIDKLKQMGIGEKAARYFAVLAGGSLGAGWQWAKLEAEGANLYETKRKLISAVASCEFADALDLAERFLKESKRIAGIWANINKNKSSSDIEQKVQKALIQIIMSAYYDVMNLNVAPAREMINFDQEEQIKKLAGRLGSQDAAAAAEKIDDCYRAMRWVEDSVNEKLIFEHLLLNFAGSGKIQSS